MLYARAGDKVTRESGEVVCAVAHDLVYGADPHPSDLTDWRIEEPKWASPPIDPPGRRWWRNADPLNRGFDLHFERGWGSETLDKA